jgi:hypothetical protein
MRRAICMLSAVAMLGLTAGPALAKTAKVQRQVTRHHHVLAHAAKSNCDGVSRGHWFYRGSCRHGEGSPPMFTLDYAIGGWIGFSYLNAQLQRRGMPARDAGSIIGNLRSASAANDKQRPYDWAKDAPRSKLKAALISCLFWGTFVASATTLYTWLFDKNTAIKDAAKAGAIACAANTVGPWLYNRLQRYYRLEA